MKEVVFTDTEGNVWEFKKEVKKCPDGRAHGVPVAPTVKSLVGE